MDKLNGWVTLGTLIFYLAGMVLPQLFPVAVGLAWMVAVLNWRELTSAARKQAWLLILPGLAGLACGAWHGVMPGWEDVLGINIPVLAMFVAVSFLSLATPDVSGQSLPVGRMAAFGTAVGQHLLGSVINVSAMFIFGDRMRRNGSLTREQAILLARSYTSAAWWSPFFMATGVAFTYAPDMIWLKTLVPGLIMSVLTLLFTSVEMGIVGRKPFGGYPFGVESMRVPMMLAVLVLLAHFWWPSIRVLTLICLLAPVGALLFMQDRPRLSALQRFMAGPISMVNGPFTLFLAAGVFSSGIKAVIRSFPDLFALGGALTPGLFLLLLCGMVLVGIAGVHPVVSISVLSPLLLPLQPDHSRLAFLFLSSWAISTCSSPLSGVGLIMAGRYHIPGRVMVGSNILFAPLMILISWIMSLLFFKA